MKHLRKFNENKDFNVEEIKEYLEDVLMELPTYFNVRIDFYESPVCQFLITIRSGEIFTIEEVSMIFNHIENYLKGFGFRKNEREGYFDIDLRPVRNPMNFELISINYHTYLSYIKRN
jgi:hypothetical protein